MPGGFRASLAIALRGHPRIRRIAQGRLGNNVVEKFGAYHGRTPYALETYRSRLARALALTCNITIERLLSRNRSEVRHLALHPTPTPQAHGGHGSASLSGCPVMLCRRLGMLGYPAKGHPGIRDVLNTLGGALERTTVRRQSRAKAGSPPSLRLRNRVIIQIGGSIKMKKIVVTVECPECHKQIDAKEMLRKILQRAGHQPGDKFYAEIIEKIGFPGE